MELRAAIRSRAVGDVIHDGAVSARDGDRDATASAQRLLLYHSVFMTMADGVMCRSISGEVTAVNPAAARILGLSPEQMTSMTLDAPDWQAVHEDGTPFPRESHPSMVTLRTGEPQSNIVMGVRKPDGTRAWISINSQPVASPGESRPHAVVTTFHDISARFRAEQEIRTLNATLKGLVANRTQQLEAAVVDLESFSDSISHDLRSPLRAIDNFSRILHEEYSNRLDDEGRRLIGVVRKNAARMAALIADLLAFARAVRRDLVLDDIDLEALVSTVLDELSPSLANRRVNIQVNAIPHVCGDKAVIRQVLMNLLSNAIKFTRSREFAQIQIHAYPAGNEVVCSVKDNGVGFESEYGHRLFRIFQRLHDAEEFEGSGIGLGIVKRIIEKHGGRVWAEGSPGVGATFYFSLPNMRKRANV
jgi:PAS domain S-box-containing protein